VDRDAVRAFARRPWRELEELKREHWARRFAEEGPSATIAASRAIWAHLRAVRPEWPTPEDREADLRDHVRLKALLDRAADALARR
jgi:hypothetical protein